MTGASPLGPALAPPSVVSPFVEQAAGVSDRCADGWSPAPVSLPDEHAVATSAATVVKGAAELLTDLATAVAGVGPGQSLAGKVAAIQRRVAAGDTVHACVLLNAFILDVRTLHIFRKISRAQAASLIGQARDIQSALACQRRCGR